MYTLERINYFIIIIIIIVGQRVKKIFKLFLAIEQLLVDNSMYNITNVS